MIQTKSYLVNYEGNQVVLMFYNCLIMCPLQGMSFTNTSPLVVPTRGKKVNLFYILHGLLHLTPWMKSLCYSDTMNLLFVVHPGHQPHQCGCSWGKQWQLCFGHGHIRSSSRKGKIRRIRTSVMSTDGTCANIVFTFYLLSWLLYKHVVKPTGPRIIDFHPQKLVWPLNEKPVLACWENWNIKAVNFYI